MNNTIIRILTLINTDLLSIFICFRNPTLQNPTLQNPIVQNPTYEVEGPKIPKAQQEQPARLQHRGEENHSSSLMTVLEKGIPPKPSKVEVYEAVDEPINEEEQALEDCHQTLPYAIHDFSEDKPPPDIKASKPNRPRGSSSDNKPKFNGNNNGSTRKPQMFRRVVVKPPIPSYPGRSSPVHHGAMDFDPGGAYSELDKKTSYASLDPHTGLNTGARDMTVMTESYGHLNH